MVSEIDVWRSANLLIQQHGPSAWLIAAERICNLRMAGDEEGAQAFERIAQAIAEFDDAHLQAEN